MGQLQHNAQQQTRSSRRKLRPRVCLRCDCGQVFLPSRWNQRYCRLPICRKEVSRWQAAKRQQRRRKRPQVRETHADAERKRRAQRRDEDRAKADPRGDRDLKRVENDDSSRRELPETRLGADRRDPGRCPDRAVPHTPGPRQACSPATSVSTHPSDRPDQRASGKEPPPGDEGCRAWSRSKRNPGPFCDRPGCYRPVRSSNGCPARYCSDECRQDTRRVQDRERKWCTRNTEAGRYKRRLEYEAARQARCTASSCRPTVKAPSASVTGPAPVVNSRSFPTSRISCCDPKEGPADDREKNFGRRPRAPPSA